MLFKSSAKSGFQSILHHFEIVTKLQHIKKIRFRMRPKRPDRDSNRVSGPTSIRWSEYKVERIATTSDRERKKGEHRTKLLLCDGCCSTDG